MSQKTIIDSHGYREEAAKNEIAGWLVKNGIGVWWEKKNKFGYDVFSTETGNKKPDLLMRWKDNVVLVEVKDGDSFSNVYNSFFQLIGYYGRISVVTANEKQMKVTGFVVATQHSEQGRLFREEPLVEYESFSYERKRAVLKGNIPFSEYRLTEMFIRLLWRAPQRPNISIGGLLSSKLNCPSGESKPAVLMKRNTEQLFSEMKP